MRRAAQLDAAPPQVALRGPRLGMPSPMPPHMGGYHFILHSISFIPDAQSGNWPSGSGFKSQWMRFFRQFSQLGIRRKRRKTSSPRGKCSSCVKGGTAAGRGATRFVLWWRLQPYQPWLQLAAAHLLWFHLPQQPGRQQGFAEAGGPNPGGGVFSPWFCLTPLPSKTPWFGKPAKQPVGHRELHKVWQRTSPGEEQICIPPL